MTSPAEEDVIRRCREGLIEIDEQLAELDLTRKILTDEQGRLSLTIEAARDPSVLNRRRRP